MTDRIDLTTPGRVFDVPTVRVEGNRHYMGPDVRVNARDSAHAKEVAASHGHVVNRHFQPSEVKGKR